MTMLCRVVHCRKGTAGQVQNTEWRWRMKQIWEAEAIRSKKDQQRYWDWATGFPCA